MGVNHRAASCAADKAKSALCGYPIGVGESCESSDDSVRRTCDSFRRFVATRGLLRSRGGLEEWRPAQPNLLTPALCRVHCAALTVLEPPVRHLPPGGPRHKAGVTNGVSCNVGFRLLGSAVLDRSLTRRKYRIAADPRRRNKAARARSGARPLAIATFVTFRGRAAESPRAAVGNQASSTSCTSYWARRSAVINRSRWSRSRVSHSTSRLRPLAGRLVKMRWCDSSRMLTESWSKICATL